MSKDILWPHQIEALNKIKNGCILNGGTGSGKSRTSLAYYISVCGGAIIGNRITAMTNPLNLYIITTARKRDSYEWEDELKVYSLKPGKNENRKYPGLEITIDSWNNIRKYENIKDTFFIFDEQRVVGNGRWAKTFLNISKSNKWIMLSATPGDDWMDYISVFIANGFYKNRTQFCREHIIYSRFAKYPKPTGIMNEKRLIRLRDLILIDMDVMRKTSRHEITVKCDYDIFKYKDVRKNRWDPFKEEPIQQASTMCYILRRIVNEHPSRINLVDQLVKQHKRVIIFYNFDYELEILKNHDFGSEFEIAEWNGHCHQFIPETEKWIYLVQYTAGCEGWNCVKTDTIIFFSQNYSYKVLEQARGRIDRINTQYTDLYYYHLKSCASIDIAINRALINKKKFVEKKFIPELKF